MKELEATSNLFGSNAPYVEELYERWLADPGSVEPSWSATFEAWQKGGGAKDVAHSAVIAAFERAARSPHPCRGFGPERRQMSHLAAGARLHLAVQMQFYVRIGESGGPVRLAVLPDITEQIRHRRRAIEFGRTERKPAYCSDLLFELRRYARAECEVT